MTRRAIDPRQLDFVDVVTSSHNHTDHLDADTLGPLLEMNPQATFIVPAANREFAAKRLAISSERIAPIDEDQSISASGFTLQAIPSAHESVERDSLGRCLYFGYVIEAGPWTLYHSGDTILWDGLAARLRRWPIDLALLPINGRAPERRVSGNLWGAEAAALARAMGAAVAIPCHYELFEFNTASPDEFVAHCESRGQSYRVLRSGERWSGRM
jgi:L-ascorbate metabolism protein UlaG (beta-lactamase superfamily)